jgi:hypothetical protein
LARLSSRTSASKSLILFASDDVTSGTCPESIAACLHQPRSVSGLTRPAGRSATPRRSMTGRAPAHGPRRPTAAPAHTLAQLAGVLPRAGTDSLSREFRASINPGAVHAGSPEPGRCHDPGRTTQRQANGYSKRT